jgi:hypothetical protein
MARHSSAELSVAEVALESPRIEPPGELSPEEAIVWGEITAAMPPSWFDSGNAPVLRELCVHLVLSRQLGEQLRALRRTNLTAATVRGQRQREAFCDLVNMAAAESKLIAQLSVKLRLTNSSHRRDEKYDDRRRFAQPNFPRPWERHS